MKPDTHNQLIPPEQLTAAAETCGKIIAELDRILLGRHRLHKMVLTGLLSRGHILLEGVPGIGKTALVKTLSQLFGLNFNRVQFTPDLMPGDILGMHILQENDAGQRQMVFHEGPVFANLLLADEILTGQLRKRNQRCLRPCRNARSPLWALQESCRWLRSPSNRTLNTGLHPAPR